MYSKVAVLLALAGSSFAVAQNDLPPIPGPELDPLPLVASRPTAIYTPLTPKETFRYSFNRVFNPSKLLSFERWIRNGKYPARGQREGKVTGQDTRIALVVRSFAKTWLSQCAP